MQQADTRQRRTARLAELAGDFLGLSDGPHRRIYLDTTATALMPGWVWRGLERYLVLSCANSHTEAHRAGRETTKAIEDSRDLIGRLVGYDAARDVVLFTSNGATGAVNFLARALFPPELRPVLKRFPGGPPAGFVKPLRAALGAGGAEVIDRMLARPLVVTTRMEHHSNLLPWIEAVGRHNLRVAPVDRRTGVLDLPALARICETEGGRVRLVAVTGTSNVTGIVNPVHDIARIAHAVGAEIAVDGAQWVPHAPVQMHPHGPGDPSADLDYLVFSGHKLYAPGSRGALAGRLASLEGARCVTDVGGGMVEYVSIEDYEIKAEVTAREEAGTPNIPGTVAMGLVARELLDVGMDLVGQAEHALAIRLLERVGRIDGVRIAGSTDVAAAPRAGVVSFDVAGLPHGLVAAYLDDAHNIAVRNGCFCAQPYVADLLGWSGRTRPDRRLGLVRASLGMYSTGDDVEALGEALEALIRDRDAVVSRYVHVGDGHYRLAGAAPPAAGFDLREDAGAALPSATRRPG